MEDWTDQRLGLRTEHLSSEDEKKKERFASLLGKLPDQGVEKCPEEIQVRFRNLIRIETR